jgi:hypothetical protein
MTHEFRVPCSRFPVRVQGSCSRFVFPVRERRTLTAEQRTPNSERRTQNLEANVNTNLEEGTGNGERVCP